MTFTCVLCTVCACSLSAHTRQSSGERTCVLCVDAPCMLIHANLLQRERERVDMYSPCCFELRLRKAHQRYSCRCRHASDAKFPSMRKRQQMDSAFELPPSRLRFCPLRNVLPERKRFWFSITPPRPYSFRLSHLTKGCGCRSSWTCVCPPAEQRRVA
jgi:hypothetical protein